MARSTDFYPGVAVKPVNRVMYAGTATRQLCRICRLVVDFCFAVADKGLDGMRKRLIGIVAAIMTCLLGSTVAHAEPLRQQKEVQITSPERNAEVRGVIPIIGSASLPDFQFYKIEFGVGPNPADWAVIGSLRDAPVVNGQLEVWDTTKLPDGVYTLRLQAVKQDGNYDEFFVPQVAIVNSRPTATEAPTATATRPVTPTRRATPKATATLQIIAPTAALSMPTSTPTLSRPDQRNPLPVDPKGWGQAFCFGSLAMGAVFVLLGIVFGLRRLL